MMHVDSYYGYLPINMYQYYREIKNSYQYLLKHLDD